MRTVHDRAGRYADRIREELRRTFAEAYPPRATAGSFALGTFVTMLPTMGVGLLVFVAVTVLSDRTNGIALFASVVVFNPVVKWGVYVASFGLGVLILGPVESDALASASLDAGPGIVARLLVGNLVLAVGATVVSYVLVYRLAVAYRTSEVGELVEEPVEEIIEA